MAVAEFAAAWGVLYLLTKHAFFPQHSQNFANRFVSFIHALVAIPLSAAAIRWPQLFTDFGQPTTTAEARSHSLARQ